MGKKSISKAVGLKSIFIDNEKLILTSFDKGNKANLEKIIKDSNIIYENKPVAFTTVVNGKRLNLIKSSSLKTVIDNPLRVSDSNRRKKAIEWAAKINEQPRTFLEPGEDQLRAKEKLEDRFYGESFNDNIKVQIAYNILDIKKILAPYINDIVFTVNNLNPKANKDADLVGTIPHKVSYDEFSQSDIKNVNRLNEFNSFIDNSKPYMPYLGKVFIKGHKNLTYLDEGNNKQTKKVIEYQDNQYIYSILRLLSFVRQSVTHGYNESDDILFDSNNYDSHLQYFLSNIYKQKIDIINKEFINLNSKSNFEILARLYDIKLDNHEDRKILKLFYDFVIRSDGKNLGFSIKKLRESMIEITSCNELQSKNYDSVRSKLYTFLDFVIYKYYLDQQQENNAIVKFVERLRESMSDEDKESIYKQEAKICWNAIQNLIQGKLIQAIHEISNGCRKLKTKLDLLSIKELEDIFVYDDAHIFSKLIYFLTLFLDGKDINDLLSNLINKFENISSLIYIDKNRTGKKVETIDDMILRLQAHFNKGTNKDYIGNETRLKPLYLMFEESQKIADDLRFIKNIARMDKEMFITKEIYFDAMRILGNPEHLKKKTKENEVVIIEDPTEIEELILDDMSTNNKGLRNFLINNVIKSRNFIYLARHVNIKNANDIGKNVMVIRFVLKQMPESQIDRYYSSITDGNNNYENKINFLADRIVNFNFNSISNVIQNAKNIKDEKDKGQKRILVGLFLTVLYRIYRNLNRINSRYVIGFHCLERDSNIHFNRFNSNSLENVKRLANLFISQRYLSKKQSIILSKNLTNFNNQKAFIDYRNKVTHLNVITNAHQYIANCKGIKSYFELYHFVCQSLLYDLIDKDYNKESDSFIVSALKRTINKGIYSKDLLHVLNSPFGYNTARYKNLSIQDLFDKNDITKEKTKERDKVLSKTL